MIPRQTPYDKITHDTYQLYVSEFLLITLSMKSQEPIHVRRSPLGIFLKKRTLKPLKFYFSVSARLRAELLSIYRRKKSTTIVSCTITPLAPVHKSHVVDVERALNRYHD